MKSALPLTGSLVLDYLSKLGQFVLFFQNILYAIPTAIKRPRIIFEQIYALGALTLIIIVISGLFIGMGLAMHGYNQLVIFGSESSLGQLVAIFLVREIGPVLTALLFAGRAGSALTAEVGMMKITEQLDAMTMMAVNPISRIMAPRFIAGIIAVPILTSIMIVIGIIGGYMFSMLQFGVDSGVYIYSTQKSIHLLDDVLNSMIKSVVFGVVVNWIALFNGIRTAPTPDGIGRATTKTVVYSSLVVLGINYILTVLLFIK